MTTNVHVDYAPRIAHIVRTDPGRAEVAARVAAAVSRLVESLGLRGDVALSWAESAATSPAGDVVVRVDGRRCGGHWSAAFPTQLRARELADAIAWCIARNRELLLTPETVDSIWNEWNDVTSPFAVRTGVPPRFAALFGLLVARGRNVLRTGFDVAPPSIGPDAWAVEAAYDAVLPPRMSTSLALRVGALPVPDFEGTGLTALLEQMRDDVFTDMGIIVPGPEVTVDDDLATEEYVVHIDDMALPQSIGADPADPQTARHIAFRTGELVRQHADAFITVETTDFMLGRLCDTAPATANAALERYGTARIAAVLRHLAALGQSVRHLAGVLDVLLEVRAAAPVLPRCHLPLATQPGVVVAASGAADVDDLTPADLADHVVRTMSRAVTRRASPPGEPLYLLPLAPGLEERLRTLSQQPLTDAETDTFIGAVAAQIGAGPDLFRRTAVAVSPDVRRAAHALLKSWYPQITVLAMPQIDPLAPIHVIGLAEPQDVVADGAP